MRWTLPHMPVVGLTVYPAEFLALNPADAPACSAPAEGVPAGKRFTIGGVPCYVVEPRDRATFRDSALILIPDATGISNAEIRLLAGA